MRDPIKWQGEQWSDSDNKEADRGKCLRDIFEFYTRQVNKQLNMGEFLRFTLEFRIPTSKSKCLELFKKHQSAINFD